MRAQQTGAFPMFRRSFLRTLGAGAAAGTVLGALRPAAAAAGSSASEGVLNPVVAGLDLRDVDVVDSHMHPLIRSPISVAYDKQAAGFSEAFAQPGDYPGRAELLANMKRGFAEGIWDQPRRIGYFNYVARTYGVPATFEGFDSVVVKHIGSDADFTAYIGSILDREKIRTL